MADIKNDLSTGLVSYWSLNETSGARYDAHGSNNLTSNGTGGVGSATGKISNGADFESGDSDYLEITDASQSGLEGMSELSISCWVKFETTQDYAPVIAKWNETGNQRSYAIALNGGYFAFWVSDTGDNPGTDLVTDTSTAVTTGVWYHVVGRYKNETNGLKIYVNNTATSGAPTNCTGSIYNSSATVRIGAADIFAGFTRKIDAVIDEVGVWNTALTSDNVTTLYNSGNGIPYLDATSVSGNTALATNLVSYWELESDGTDSKGTNDVTASGSPTYVTGIQGNGVDLEVGSNQYLSITDASATDIEFQTNFTVNFWTKLESTTGAGWFAKFFWTGAVRQGLHVQYLGADDKRLKMEGQNTTAFELAWAHQFEIATWYMVTLQYNTTTGDFRLYVNAASQGTVDTTGTGALTTNTKDFYLGSDYWTAQQIPLDGIMDEFGYWSRELTAGEVSALYNDGTGLPYDTPASGIPFNTASNLVRRMIIR